MKKWKKPILRTLNGEQLKAYIRAAAWSGCDFGNFR